VNVNGGSGSNEASLIVADGPLVGPVLGRVVGMLAARAECPIDRLDDALIVADAVAARAGSFSQDGRVHVHVAAEHGSVELRVGPLRADGAAELVESAALPGVGNVLEAVADGLEPERDEEGDAEYLRIRVDFAEQQPPTIDRMGSDVS
jgi:hypothetical protein